jgi:hypothetical protein
MMISDLKFGERTASARAPAGPQLALADRIEGFGRAMTAKQLATILAVSTIAIYKNAKAGRPPSFRIGTSV